MPDAQPGRAREQGPERERGGAGAAHGALSLGDARGAALGARGAAARRDGARGARGRRQDARHRGRCRSKAAAAGSISPRHRDARARSENRGNCLTK
eukprot:6195848-Pleurochrysis_carterae.AAC.3